MRYTVNQRINLVRGNWLKSDLVSILTDNAQIYPQNQINPGTPYGTYMSHVFFLHLLH